MFQFPGLARALRDQSSFDSSPGLVAVFHALYAFWCQDIPHTPLLAWPHRPAPPTAARRAREPGAPAQLGCHARPRGIRGRAIVVIRPSSRSSKGSHRPSPSTACGTRDPRRRTPRRSPGKTHPDAAHASPHTVLPRARHVVKDRKEADSFEPARQPCSAGPCFAPSEPRLTPFRVRRCVLGYRNLRGTDLSCQPAPQISFPHDPRPESTGRRSPPPDVADAATSHGSPHRPTQRGKLNVRNT